MSPKLKLMFLGHHSILYTMKRHLPLLLGLCLVYSCGTLTRAQTLNVSTPMPAPNWVLLQREVLKVNA